jgi:hypothetical protein
MMWVTGKHEDKQKLKIKKKSKIKSQNQYNCSSLSYVLIIYDPRWTHVEANWANHHQHVIHDSGCDGVSVYICNCLHLVYSEHGTHLQCLRQ